MNKEAKVLIDLASYRAMTHTNDAQTVHTCQTRSVRKPRPPAYIQGPACIQGPASNRGNTVIELFSLALSDETLHARRKFVDVSDF